MRSTMDSGARTANVRHIALSASYTEPSCDVVPTPDQYEALDVYRAVDDGKREAVPLAQAACVDFHQRQ